MWLRLVILLAARAAARDVTDEEYAKFPPLYHLDDYSSCLSQVDGLYCLGTFQLAPLKEPDPTYNMIKEYSQNPHHFNRQELHRGYCVSSRCPTLATERNTSRRFELCAAQWGRRHSLLTTLSKLGYCRTYVQEYARTHNPEPIDTPQRVFLLVLIALVMLNTLGTTYDVVMGADNKKNPLLMSWSLRTNWQRLTATYEDGDPRLSALTPVQGIRVLLMVLIIATHSACIHDMLFLYNPRWVEQISRHPVLMIFLNGTSVVQVFVMLSSFLLAYNMLLYGKSYRLTFKMLPLITLKRIARYCDALLESTVTVVRGVGLQLSTTGLCCWSTPTPVLGNVGYTGFSIISPVHLLVVGYAATWWVRSNSGPMWTTTVGAESDICREKFWTHVLYIFNLIDPDNTCLIPTWFLAVDMQLYFVAASLTLVLSSVRQRALPILAVLVVASSILNGVLAYIYNWQSIMFFAYPRTLRTMYHGIPSFTKLYQSPWGSLPGSMVGIFFAFLHFEMQEAGIKMTSYKWLRGPYYLGPAAMVGWMLSGYWLRQFTAPWFVATYVAVERPVLSALGGFVLLGMINGLEGCLKHIFAWRGWVAMGRMSLAVLALHWCLNMSVAAARPQPIASSLLNVVIDTVSTGTFSYALAIPLTIMVEMPVQRTVAALM